MNKHFSNEAIQEIIDLSKPERKSEIFSDIAKAEIKHIAANPSNLEDLTLLCFTREAASEIAHIILTFREKQS